MIVISITEFRKKMFSLVKDLEQFSDPICIVGPKSQSVLVSKEEYDSMIETMYVLKHTGVSKSILECDLEYPSQWSDTLED